MNAEHPRPLEWVVGRCKAPMYVTEDGRPIRPDIVVCVDVGSGGVVGSQACFPDEPLRVVIECVSAAMLSPAAGAAPARPRRIRVEAELLRELLARAYPDIEIVLAATPEVDEYAHRLATSYLRGEPPPSYLEHGRVRPEIVEEFFGAAAQLFRVQPWELMGDDFLFSVDVPVLGIRRACLSVIGALEQTRGLLLFTSLDDYQQFLQAGRAGQPSESERDLGTHIFSVTFEQGSHVARSLRREIGVHGWEVAGPQAYPSVVRLDPDQITRPLVESDYLLATACAVGLAQFCSKHRPMFSETDPAPMLEVIHYRTAPEYVIEITAPHPDMTLVFRDVQGRSRGARVRANIAPTPERALAAQQQVQHTIAAFLDAQRLDGQSAGLCAVAENICRELMRWKQEDLDGNVQRWTAAQVQYFLLEVVPERGLPLTPKQWKLVPLALQKFFVWLTDEGRLNKRTGDAVAGRVASVRSQFLKAMRERRDRDEASPPSPSSQS